MCISLHIYVYVYIYIYIYVYTYAYISGVASLSPGRGVNLNTAHVDLNAAHVNLNAAPADYPTLLDLRIAHFVDR